MLATPTRRTALQHYQSPQARPPSPSIKTDFSDFAGLQRELPSDFAPINSNGHFRPYENGSLAIHNANKLDTGFFMCAASNGGNANFFLPKTFGPDDTNLFNLVIFLFFFLALCTVGHISKVIKITIQGKCRLFLL